MLRLYSLFCLGLGLAALSACAHEQESVADAARASCEERGIAAGPAMDSCIADASTAIREARERQDAPVPPPHARGHLSPPSAPIPH